MTKCYRLTVLLLVTAGAAGAQTVGCSRFTATSGNSYRIRPAYQGDGFARMQVDTLFSGIVLSTDQWKSAIEIVQSTLALSRTASNVSAGAQTIDPVWGERNARLATLLTSDTAKAKLADNIGAMRRSPFRCDLPAASG